MVADAGFVLEFNDLILPPVEPEDQNPVWDYTIGLGDREFRLVLRFNGRMNAWYFDLYVADGDALIRGKRLVTENWTQIWKPLTQDPRWVEQGDSSSDDDSQRRGLYLLDVDGGTDEADYEALGRSHQIWYATQNDLLVHLVISEALPPGFDFEGTGVVSVTILP